MKITVTGSSRVKVPAECAQVAFGVSRRGGDHDTVIAEVSAVAQEVRALLSELTPDDDGDQAHLSGLRTWTDFPHGEEPVHVAQMDGSVMVWELSELGVFLARLGTVDGATVDSVQWKLTRNTRDAVEPEAIQDAFQDARQRARWIASAAGRQGFEVVSVTDGGGEPGYHFKAAYMRDGGAPSLDLDPVDVEISASLTVVFEDGHP
ncbi:MAG: SIMPL domain-containing protein [Propionibacteriaceae bacterium]|nr:SIMPL domain-containing protein [Propionibacteriaceae bacterium]